MTNEEIIEEILHEAHHLGIYEQVLKLAKTSKYEFEVDKMQDAFNRAKLEVNIS